MLENSVYMDHNATALLDDDVKRILSLDYANPSSLHFPGQKARDIVEGARSDIVTAFNATDSELVFTSSGTEANNMIFHSFSSHIHIVSSIEHPSILKSAINPTLISVTDEGVVKLDELESVLKKLKMKKILVSVMMANNETGVIQPIREISKLTHDYCGIVHLDAAQGCGKIDVDMDELEVDMMSISPHKFGALKGVGALVFRKNLTMKPLIVGGGQENKLRAGTENVVSISSFGLMALKIPQLVQRMQEIEVMRDELEVKILDICPQVKIFSNKSKRLPNTSCIAMPNTLSGVQLMHFDQNRIAVGQGSACSSGVVGNRSHVLEAMGIRNENIENALRISLGYKNNKKDINKFVNCWKVLYNMRN